jgi:hypothetical protein
MTKSETFVYVGVADLRPIIPCGLREADTSFSADA